MYHYPMASPYITRANSCMNGLVSRRPPKDPVSTRLYKFSKSRVPSFFSAFRETSIPPEDTQTGLHHTGITTGKCYVFLMFHSRAFAEAGRQRWGNLQQVS